MTLAPAPDDGFDTLKVAFGSFPMVKLDGGTFMCDGVNIGPVFHCVLQQARQLFLWTNGDANDKSAEFFYTYDDVVATDGTMVQERLAEWVRQGRPGTRQTRAEVVCLILDGVVAQRVVLLSVPEKSTNKLAGYRDIVKMGYRLALQQVVTKVSVGEPIRRRDGKTFRPWIFDYAGVYQAAAA